MIEDSGEIMRIAIIGAGKVGQALGSSWAAGDHDVVYGVRNPSAPDKWLVDAHMNVTTPAAAVTDASVIVLAVPWSATLGMLATLGDLEGKVVVDPSNAVKFGGPIVERTLTSELSSAELLQAAIPKAHVVKAFNQYGAEVLAEPSAFWDLPVLLMAGDDAGAKDVVRTLAEDAGFCPLDAGSLVVARLIEDMARLWMTLVPNPELGRRFAFSLLTRKSA